MFAILFAILGVLLGACVWWTVRRALSLVCLLPQERWVHAVTLLGTQAALGLICAFWNAFAIVLAYFCAFVGVCQLIALLVRAALRTYRERKGMRIYSAVHRSAIVPLCAAVIVAICAVVNFSDVVHTRYTVRAPELQRAYRIVLISDTHYGGAQSTSVLPRYIEEINALNADLVVLGGDITEEETSAEEMRAVFQTLGGLKSTFGTYYVYGNHDTQPYTRDKSFTTEELRRSIEDAGIVVLADNAVPIGEELLLVGRKDKSMDRLPAADLTGGVTVAAEQANSRYTIFVDHQPSDAEENAAAGAKLQLSGHTHAGQIWPLGWFMRLFGTPYYGNYTVDGCRVIVSSGFAGWGFPLRTQKHCEYVSVDLTT